MNKISNLTAKILMASRPHCPDIKLLSILSQLGELNDKGREQVLETARIAYGDATQRMNNDYSGSFDHGCYRD